MKTNSNINDDTRDLNGNNKTVVKSANFEPKSELSPIDIQASAIINLCKRSVAKANKIRNPLLIKEDSSKDLLERNTKMTSIQKLKQDQIKKQTTDQSIVPTPLFRPSLPKEDLFKDLLEKNETSIQELEQVTTEEKTFSCLHCMKSFHIKETMKIHSGEKTFNCKDCEKSFLKKESLKHHQCWICTEWAATNAKEKPFACQHCTKSFTKKSYMKAHEKVHTGEAFSCKFCDKSFSLESNLKMHKRIHTGDKPFSCRHCDQKFSQKSGAQGHERTHTGETPFSCEYCKRRFNRKDTLNNHARRHTETKPQCNFCGKEFLNAAYVKKHEDNVCKKKSQPRLKVS